MTALVIADLTEASLNGKGVFDVLMRANKAHLESEFQKNRIKGSEYSTVYLGSLEAAMRISLEFLTQRQRIELEAKLLEQQIILAEVGVKKANAELLIVEASLAKIPLELAELTAKTGLINAQKANAEAELAIITANGLKIPAEIAHIEAQTAQSTQQTKNLTSTKLQIENQTALVQKQVDNAILEGNVLVGQKCKLDAEYDLLLGNTLKTASETALLTQKGVTEKAQVTALGVDADSVIGKQKALYAAQTSGFARDAEQKAAKLMADVWSVQRTTDSGIGPTAANKLTDEYIGRAVEKLMTGVGA